MHPALVLLLSVAVVFALILRLKINAFVALITAAIAVGLLSPTIAFPDILKQVAESFGSVVGKIGISIALAAVIGQCLMESGAADKITRQFVRWFGDRFSSLALLVSGFVLAVPVFFDTVFYLLIPLARALRVRTGKNYLLFVMAICAGGVATHTMVPPTPGPLAVASELNIDLGAMILTGLTLGAPTAMAGWLFARWLDRKFHVGFREAPGMTMEDLTRLAHREEKELPPFWLSLTPIVLPVLLISGKTVAEAVIKAADPNAPAAQATVMTAANTAGQDTAPLLIMAGRIAAAMAFFGNPNFALLAAAGVAMAMLARQRKYSLTRLAEALEPSLASGGLIILITAGGGAYGAMLQNAGVGNMLANTAAAWGIPLLPMAFGLAALLKIAQGSSTVAMITTAGIVKGMLQTAPLEFHPVYLALCIASGSLVGSWMNDSGFWIYKQMAGLTEDEALRSWTPLLALVGGVGGLISMLGSWLLPLR